MVKLKRTLWAVAEVLCLLLALYGVAAVYVPAALILAGVLGVVAIEQYTAEPKRPARREGG
ncbi:hypothetical protein [Streptomyces sp. NPDC088923]|uniref:hypothetical protein n=1 Tax=Streptomyces sp. NPDC088923 TaxID=3365913 RepID=UPI0037FF03AB